MSGKESGANIELILKHFIEQQDKYNLTVTNQLDKMNSVLDELRDHKGLVLQLDKRMDSAEDTLSDMKEKLQKLVYDSNRRDDIKKTITNPLIQRSIFSIIGVVACSFCFVIGFSYKTIDQKSTKEMQTFMKR